jgi:branched-chain amino acid transport system substrate-binding protein
MYKFSALLCLFFALIAINSCSESNPCDCEKSSITIGALLPLSGSGASSGEGMQSALNIAKNEIEAYLKSINSALEFKLVVADTKTDAAEALVKLKELAAQGIKIFVGPYSSSEAQAIKSYADENGLLILSPSSEAISLAIAHDNLFRFVPSDLFLAKAIERFCEVESIKHVIPIYRDDVWGTDLVAAFRNNLQSSGNSMATGIKYSVNTNDFSQIVSQLNDLVVSELNSTPENDISIFLASFNEGTTILNEAAKYPDLARVNWIGSSAYALDKSILEAQNSAAAAFAMQQNLACPIYRVDVQSIPNGQQLLNQIIQQIGREPDVYALAIYDALWVAVKTVVAVGIDSNIDKIKDNLLNQAANYNGATGNTALNDAGDRLKGDYDFWGISFDNVNSIYYWEKVATYLAEQDEIVK